MPETPDPLDEFPRQVARTRGFSLGVPRSFTVSPDGERVVYLRTKRGDDPVSCLWVFEVSGAKERLVFDPGGGEAGGALPQAARARGGRGGGARGGSRGGGGGGGARPRPPRARPRPARARARALVGGHGVRHRR